MTVLLVANQLAIRQGAVLTAVILTLVTPGSGVTVALSSVLVTRIVFASTAIVTVLCAQGSPLSRWATGAVFAVCTGLEASAWAGFSAFFAVEAVYA